MKILRIATMTLCLIGAIASTGEASTTFNGSTIVRIDQARGTITFQTREGQTWTLPVADRTILGKEQFAKGNRVSIVIDLSDRITKILKLSDQPRSDQIPSREDLRP